MQHLGPFTHAPNDDDDDDDGVDALSVGSSLGAVSSDRDDALRGPPDLVDPETHRIRQAWRAKWTRKTERREAGATPEQNQRRPALGIETPATTSRVADDVGVFDLSPAAFGVLLAFEDRRPSPPETRSAPPRVYVDDDEVPWSSTTASRRGRASPRGVEERTTPPPSSRGRKNVALAQSLEDRDFEAALFARRMEDDRRGRASSSDLLRPPTWPRALDDSNLEDACGPYSYPSRGRSDSEGTVVQVARRRRRAAKRRGVTSRCDGIPRSAAFERTRPDAAAPCSPRHPVQHHRHGASSWLSRFVGSCCGASRGGTGERCAPFVAENDPRAPPPPAAAAW